MFLFSQFYPLRSIHRNQLIRSYLVHSVYKSSIRSNSVHLVSFSHFGLIRSIQSTLALFDPHWSYFVHIGLLRSTQSTLALFGPHWSYSVHSVHFDPLQSNSGHSVHFGLIGPFCLLWFTSVLFSLHYFYSVHFSLLCLPWSYSVHSIHFGSIRSNLVLFGPPCSYCLCNTNYIYCRIKLLFCF